MIPTILLQCSASFTECASDGFPNAAPSTLAQAKGNRVRGKEADKPGTERARRRRARTSAPDLFFLFFSSPTSFQPRRSCHFDYGTLGVSSVLAFSTSTMQCSSKHIPTVHVSVFSEPPLRDIGLLRSKGSSLIGQTGQQFRCIGSFTRFHTHRITSPNPAKHQQRQSIMPLAHYALCVDKEMKTGRAKNTLLGSMLLASPKSL